MRMNASGDERRALRLRRQELRRRMADLRRQARARARSMHPAIGRRGRRRWRLAAVPLLLLLLLLLRCPGEPQPAPSVARVDARAAARPVSARPPPEPAPAHASRRPPLTGHLETRPRAAYEGSAAGPPAWIDDLRLQAAARSPRLAACFSGSDRPGALRWNAALNPDTGTVSDHDIEPLGASSALTAEQRACVVRALSTPRYHLTRPPTQPFPERVTLVIEF